MLYGLTLFVKKTKANNKYKAIDLIKKPNINTAEEFIKIFPIFDSLNPKTNKIVQIIK